MGGPGEFDFTISTLRQIIGGAGIVVTPFLLGHRRCRRFSMRFQQARSLTAVAPWDGRHKPASPEFSLYHHGATRSPTVLGDVVERQHPRAGFWKWRLRDLQAL
jgi:hypothetical protein